MKVVKIISLLFATLIFISPLVAADSKQKAKPPVKYVVFDLGGVAFDTDHVEVVKAMGLGKCVRGVATLAQGRKKMFSILNEVPYTMGNTSASHDDSGLLMPNIMCDWMRGRLESDILQAVQQSVKANNQLTTNEKEIWNSMFSILFTPEKFLKTRYFYQDTLKLALWCKKNGLKCYGLSNWSKESFDQLKALFPQFFNLFEDGCFICSGHAGVMKPDPAIYAYGEKQWQRIDQEFTMEQAALIDDQPENIDGAKKAGMQGILVINHNLQKTHKELATLCFPTKEVISDTQLAQLYKKPINPYKIVGASLLVGVLGYLTYTYANAS